MLPRARSFWVPALRRNATLRAAACPGHESANIAAQKSAPPGGGKTGRGLMSDFHCSRQPD